MSLPACFTSASTLVLDGPFVVVLFDSTFTTPPSVPNTTDNNANTDQCIHT